MCLSYLLEGGRMQMSDLRDKNIISKYLMYVDNNCNKLRGNANFYEASESLRIHIDLMMRCSLLLIVGTL